MIGASAQALAQALDVLAAANAELLDLTVSQRDPITRADVAGIERVALDLERALARAQMAEDARHQAARLLADAAGSGATRWSVLRERVDADVQALLDPRIAALEEQVRELELANAINAGLCQQELDLVDHSLRSVLAPADSGRRYTSTGGDAPSAPALPVLINRVA